MHGEGVQIYIPEGGDGRRPPPDRLRRPGGPARAPGGGLGASPPPGRGGLLFPPSLETAPERRPLEAAGEATGPHQGPASRDRPGGPRAPRQGRPPALEPPPEGRPLRGLPRQGATPRCAARGVPGEKSRLPSPAAPRTSPSRPANWSRTRPQRESPNRRRSPPQRVGTGAPLARWGPPSHPRGLVALGGPAPRRPPIGQLAAVRGKGEKERRRETPRLLPPRAAPGGAGAAGLQTPGNRPPSKRPALPGPLMGGCLYAQI